MAVEAKPVLQIQDPPEAASMVPTLPPAVPQASGSTPEPESKPKRDAIIFVPGIADQWNNQSLEAVSRQIAKALDLADPEIGACYETTMQLADLRGRSTKFCTISRHRSKGAPPTPVVDVFEIDYRPTLKHWFEQKAILMKCLIVLLALFVASWQFLKSKFAQSSRGKKIKTGGEQAQLIYASAILFVLSCYFVLLVIGAVAAYGSLSHGITTSKPPERVTETVGPVQSHSGSSNQTALIATNDTNLPPPQSFAVSAADQLTKRDESNPLTSSPKLLQWASALCILTTLLGIAAPDKWRRTIESAASDYVCVLYYLAFGSRRNTIIGEFDEFVEGFYEWAGDRIRNVHVIAYSFGSIVLLDALFPLGAGAAARVKGLQTLVSIGCPFDAVRLAWPEYFTGRNGTGNCLQRWLNIYSPNDVISSNFRNDNLQDLAQESLHCAQGVSPDPPENVPYKEGPHGQKLSFFEMALLMGLRSHSMYWEEGNTTERNCFTYIIEQMPYVGH